MKYFEEHKIELVGCYVELEEFISKIFSRNN
jgi:hypothetical protein